MMYKALDLFCGLGGWSEGLAEEGFYVLGVEVERKIAELYKYDIIVADVRTLNGRRFRGFDVIVGSPPCRDFTRMCDHAVRKDGTIWRWREPKNPWRGLENVKAFLRIVKEAQPKFWLMENVPGLCKYLDIPPKRKVRLTRTMVRCFWGNFPPFLVPCVERQKMEDVGGSLRKWLRAKIPLAVSRSFARAVKNALEVSE